MRLAILSDCRMPTIPVGGHGLGRVACDIAGGMAKRGHHVTLYAGPGSRAPGDVILAMHPDEVERVDVLKPGDADVWIDLSHYHALSRRREFKQLHYIMDDECHHEPINTVVGSQFRKRAFPTAEIVPLGIDTASIPFDETGGKHLLSVAKVHFLKGPDIALEVARRGGYDLRMYGELYGPEPAGWRGVISDNAELYKVLGAAYAFLAPYRSDAGGRVLLEAQAAGTPVLTFGDVGCISHVGHCIGGFVVSSPDEMADALDDVRYLNRKAAREWVIERHDMDVMLGALERVAVRAADGETW